MLYIKWFFLALLSLAMDAAGLVLVAVGLAIAGAARLPWYLQWFDNDREPYGDTARKPAIDAATGLRRAWLRYWWLAIRNPANNFGYLPWMGFAQHASLVYTATGNPNTSDQGESGAKLTYAWRAGRKVAFEYYLVRQWSATRCLRVRLGWKIDHNLRAEWRRNDGSATQIVAVVNPFDGFGA